jgi:hypothetical protein
MRILQGRFRDDIVEYVYKDLYLVSSFPSLAIVLYVVHSAAILTSLLIVSDVSEVALIVYRT